MVGSSPETGPVISPDNDLRRPRHHAVQRWPSRFAGTAFVRLPAKHSGQIFNWMVRVDRLLRPTLAVTLVILTAFCGCQGLVPHDTQSLIAPRFQVSEIVGLLAGFGTTFAAVPDLLAMIRRRSSAGMAPMMATIMGIFQILWVYYGLLINSRPVVAWNLIAVLINFSTIGVYWYFLRQEKSKVTSAG